MILYAGGLILAICLIWYAWYSTRKNTADKEDAIVLGVGLFAGGIVLSTVITNWIVMNLMKS